MKKPRYYFGIDLGTTNSVLAWADIEEEEGGFIVPKVVDINMPARADALARDKKDYLPSCVYFREKPPEIIVGTHAKGKRIGLPDRVEKSIKTKMGTSYKHFACNPQQISAHILRGLYNEVDDPRFPPIEALLEEVVIGVPASFEQDMCDATSEAAELARFKKSTLIHEPIAAMYDYKNQQNRGVLPNWVLDIEFSFDKPKYILVFDLGGGTLDVALYEVVLCNKQELDVKQIAVSRYTAIAGDNFDCLLAKHFLDIYEKITGIPPIASSIERQFQEYAEQAKIDLSHEIFARRTASSFDPKKCKIAFWSQGSDGTSDKICKPPDYDLTLCEYEKIVAPLLGNHLTLSDVATFCSSIPPSNIIDPILYVLKKAQSELNSEKPIIPNAVLLNGAMTRFYTIRKRLETFFPGVNVSPIGDPDKAVARGAVIAHYNMHNP